MMTCWPKYPKWSTISLLGNGECFSYPHIENPPKDHRPPSTSPACDIIAPSCRAWPPSGAWSSHPRTQLRLSLDRVKMDKMRWKTKRQIILPPSFLDCYTIQSCGESLPKWVKHGHKWRESSEIFGVDSHGKNKLEKLPGSWKCLKSPNGDLGIWGFAAPTPGIFCTWEWGSFPASPNGLVGSLVKAFTKPSVSGLKPMKYE